jgi:ABC-type multidrug transport system fused ATPase/permease subunit
MYNDFSDRLTDAECILNLLRTQPSITDSADAKSLRFRGGKVKFEGVSFAYKDGKNILEDITFDTLEATTTAFVGESGGGKTTITKLMQRLYDVDSGSILIDDQDIRQVTRNRYVKTAWWGWGPTNALPSLNKTIGVLPQDPQFFNESIMDNIRYAKLNASNDEVYEACKAAAIHNRILKFKLGYSTLHSR